MTKDMYQRIARLFSKELSLAEQKALENEISQDAEAAAALSDLNSYIEVAAEPKPDSVPDLTESWNLLASSLQLENSPLRLEPPHIGTQSRRRSRIYSIAAAIAALLTLSVGLYFYDGSTITEVVADKGTNEFHELSDGTAVWLNAGSSLSYDESSFESIRLVHLQGEAYFEVAPDAKRPFQVNTGNSVTQVLGTEFNIKSLLDRTMLTVRGGKVQFMQPNADDNSAVTVSAGFMSQIRGDLAPTEPEPVDPEMLIRWREGNLVFYQTTLAEMIAELGQVYDIAIDHNLQSPEEHSLTATFERQKIEDVIRAICLTSNLSYTIEDGKILIQAP